MIHQAPAGARDLLPLEVVQKGWINDRLQAIFQSWGYQRIVTSTIERLDTLIAGEAIDPKTVLQLQPTAEGIFGLRPELTASIARTAVTRLTDSSHPQRICYRANVFRKPPSAYHGRQLEFYQAGVELLFAGGVLADAEIILLLADCLEKLEIPQWHLILGEAGLTRSLLAAFPEHLRQQVRHCLAYLDYVTLENLAYPTPALASRAKKLFNLRGKPHQVIEALLSLELEPEAQLAVGNLKSLVELLQDNSLPLTLDLSLVQTFDYYTGIVFQVASPRGNNLGILGQGGRYDQLLSVYHPQNLSFPGIGFSLNIEELYNALLPTSVLPQAIPPLDYLIVPQTTQVQKQALHYAQNLRNSNPSLRVALDLEPRESAKISDYGRSKHLVWITPAGEAIIEES